MGVRGCAYPGAAHADSPLCFYNFHSSRYKMAGVRGRAPPRSTAAEALEALAASGRGSLLSGLADEPEKVQSRRGSWVRNGGGSDADEVGPGAAVSTPSWLRP